MILILGGTTEGRTAVKVADEAGKPYFYSTKGEWQEIQCKHGIRITGGMDTEKMESFCRQNNIRLLVDAAHPFASQLHRTVDETTGRYIFLSYVLKGSILHAPKTSSGVKTMQMPFTG